MDAYSWLRFLMAWRWWILEWLTVRTGVDSFYFGVACIPSTWRTVLLGSSAHTWLRFFMGRRVCCLVGLRSVCIIKWSGFFLRCSRVDCFHAAHGYIWPYARTWLRLGIRRCLRAPSVQLLCRVSCCISFTLHRAAVPNSSIGVDFFLSLVAWIVSVRRMVLLELSVSILDWILKILSVILDRL